MHGQGKEVSELRVEVVTPQRDRILGSQALRGVRPAQTVGGSRALDTLFLLVGDDKEHRRLGKEQIQKIFTLDNT